MKSHEANGKEINGKETNAKETNGTNANGSKEQISFNLTDMNKSWVYALLMNLSKICTCCFFFSCFLIQLQQFVVITMKIIWIFSISALKCVKKEVGND